ncbi:major facilitator superfamily transporter multidrug resistance [Coniella lustricola]|uniref:Major facilitator superfamily transporter multidrug resistance n=1 Tax=Coniella lustricola TaxID=2025994 RepID=A0A2T3A015_9PEZI|nr:major facilitator superfamily transporter multidrug resistance [Coniella lustricola]
MSSSEFEAEHQTVLSTSDVASEKNPAEPTTATAASAPKDVADQCQGYTSASLASPAEPWQDINSSQADQEPLSEQPVTSPSPDGDPSQAVEAPYSCFTLWEKRFIVTGASLAAFFSPLTAQIYFPALTVLSEAFHVSESKINLTVTTYMIFQGVTPMFIGGFADTGGRRPAYVICFVIYIGANIGVALCQTYGSLLGLRCLQSAGSASTVALCQAVLADTITSGERGQYIGITILPIVLAPSLGPVLGGILSQYLGWRSIFWFLTIIASVTLILMLFFFPETCRQLVGDGSVRPHPIYKTLWQVIKDSRRKRKAKEANDSEQLHRITTSTSRKSVHKLSVNFGNPFDSVTILLEPLLGLLLLYSGIVFAGFYAISTAMSEQLKELYDFSEIEIGLMYLPMAGGSIVAALVVGKSINWNYQRHAKRLGMSLTRGRQDDLSNFPIERARLEVGLPLLALSTCVVFAWGWALQYKSSIAVPAVLMFLVGLGMVGFSNTSSVLIVDIYPGKAGAATAANNLTRCLIGAAATAVITPLIKGVGSGWAFTVFGFLYLLGAPLLFLIMKNGIKWRRQLTEKQMRKQARIEEKMSEDHGVAGISQDQGQPLQKVDSLAADQVPDALAEKGA